MINAYATLLTDYCLGVQEGDRVLVKSGLAGLDLADQVAAICWQRGATPAVLIQLEAGQRSMISNGSASQWSAYYEWETMPIREWDALLTIQSPLNTASLLGVSTDRLTQFKSMDPSRSFFMNRSASGALRWASCIRPCAALAQDAGMGTHEFESLVYKACGLGQSDPVAYWQGVRARQERAIACLSSGTHIRYVGPTIDLVFSTDGRRWINSDGRRNMPSGEIFTAPVEDSVNGRVSFDVPIRYMGNWLKGVHFEFKNGQIVDWGCEVGHETLDALFQIDGTRVLGEIAVGLNDQLTRPTGLILLDEKMGGTVHMAIGASYPETGGLNQSVVHLDFITSMGEGEIWVDGKRVYQNGVFL